ncbi:MAG: efflux RND transporter periplasmic adaptor subunit [Verrucomicrobia bacterium]|nr:efflux RND transporter periplasmic adaptor subunit [Kiritimatiellia bacterium]MCO6401024.1 efflux RND transporter periplasmic adaptor subunit [Verrucomicrobiota bacterium]
MKFRSLFHFLLATALLPLAACSRSGENASTHTIATGPMQVWTVYPGKLEARRVEVIMSKFNGSATIVELAPEGAPVKAGDLLVKFDSSQVERDLLKLQRDFQLASSDLERIEKAELPLELRDLEAQRIEAQMTFEAEKQYLEDSRALLAEDLVSEQELEQQKLKVDQLKTQLEKLDQKIALTKDFLHPSALERARATLSSAEQELKLAKAQLANCTVLAPADGVVVYRPLHVGGEFRTVRVGDSIYKNQPFLIIPDMRDLIIEVQIPEAELARVEIGRSVRVTPLSYPDLALTGNVETVGSMATIVADRPGWQRYFRAVIGLQDADPRLRSGMSVEAEILSYSADNALLIPRSFVHMNGNEPTARIAGPPARTQPLKLGWADVQNFEVLDGLKPGDVVKP